MSKASVWAAVVAIIASSPAAAGVLMPYDTKFNIRGDVTVTVGRKHARCGVKMVGHTDGRGFGRIRSFDMKGRSPACAAEPTGLPWQVRGEGRYIAGVVGFGYANQVAPCSSRDFAVMIDDTGAWTFGGDTCIPGVLVTTPPITLKPRK